MLAYAAADGPAPTSSQTSAIFSALNPVPAPAPAPVPLSLQSCQAGVLHPLFPMLLDAIPSPVFSGVAVHRASHCTSPTALQCTALK